MELRCVLCVLDCYMEDNCIAVEVGAEFRSRPYSLTHPSHKPDIVSDRLNANIHVAVFLAICSIGGTTAEMMSEKEGSETMDTGTGHMYSYAKKVTIRIRALECVCVCVLRFLRVPVALLPLLRS